MTVIAFGYCVAVPIPSRIRAAMSRDETDEQINNYGAFFSSSASCCPSGQNTFQEKASATLMVGRGSTRARDNPWVGIALPSVGEPSRLTFRGRGPFQLMGLSWNSMITHSSEL